MVGADSDERGPAVGWGGLVLLLTSLPVAAVAVGALTGVGLARDLPGLLAVLGGAALVGLPVAGLASWIARSARPASAFGGCAWFWSLTVLLAMPLYFPGERAEAAADGLRYLSAPAGDTTSERIVGFGNTLVALLGSEPGPIPKAVALEPAGEADGPRRREPPARSEHTGEQVVPYDGEGQVMRVAVFFDGPRYGEEFPMIFDTGATYTTLNRSALEQLEVEVLPEAPRAILRTANGEVEAPLVLVDAIWLGDAVVEWVTVAVCDLCASEEVSGLLGMNFSGQFRVSLDHAEREIVLRSQSPSDGRKLDIIQWVQLSSRVRRWRDGRVEVEVTGRNLAPVTMLEVATRVECPGGSFAVLLDAIPARGTATARMSLPRDTDCSEYTLELDSARWEQERF